MVQVDKKYLPDATNVKLYDEIYEVYCLAYEALEEKGRVPGARPPAGRLLSYCAARY